MNLLKGLTRDKYKLFWLKLIILKLGIFSVFALILFGKWLTT